MQRNAMKLELGDGIQLCSPKNEDADQLFTAVDRSRESLSRWLPWVPLNTSPSHSAAFIAESIEKIERGEICSAFIHENEKILGIVGLMNIHPMNRSAEIGYWLSADAEGRGIMTRAAEALICHGFQSHSLNRIQLCAASGNLRSHAVAKRLGFVREGMARQAECLGDAFVDLVVYSRLSSDEPN